MSNIDITVPPFGDPTTQAVRDNFRIAGIEIDAAAAAAAAAQATANSKLSDAPSDGSAYGRLSTSWVQVLRVTGGTLSGGLHFGATAASGTTDLSRHLDLYSGTFGLSITSARLNLVAPAGSSVYTNVGGTDVLQVTQNFITALTSLSFGSTLASGPTDLSHHINLFGTNSYGISVTSGRINVVAAGVTSMQFGSGNILAGVPIQLPADPTAALQAATKQYVDAASGGGSAAANNAGRNLLNNALMNVAQRGVGNFTANGYTLDQWVMVGGAGDAPIVYNGGLLDTHRAQIGDEAARKALQFSVSGTAAGYSFVYQPIESLARLAGKTVIISLWGVQLGAGTPKVGVGWSQYFGTGGSPSAQVSGNAGQATLSNVMQRFQFTATIPSIAGKTLGANNNDSTYLELWFSDGANAFVPRNGGIGQQSANAMIWGVQLEIAQPGQTQASPLEKLRPSDDLARCQWFFRMVANNILYWMPTGPSQAQVNTFSYGGFMRVRPSVTFSPAYTNCSSISINGTNSLDHINVQVISVAAAAAYVFFDMALSAEL